MQSCDQDMSYIEFSNSICYDTILYHDTTIYNHLLCYICFFSSWIYGPTNDTLNMRVLLIINFLAWRIYIGNGLFITSALLQDLCMVILFSMYKEQYIYPCGVTQSHQTMSMVYEQPIFGLIGFSNLVSCHYVRSEGEIKKKIERNMVGEFPTTILFF
jgi:hypothetical protein